MKSIIILIILINYPLYASVGGSVSIESVMKKKEGERVLTTDLGLWYNFSIKDVTIKPYTNIKTWFVTAGNIVTGGAPFKEIYLLGGNIGYKNLILDFNHYCSHSVVANMLIIKSWNAIHRENASRPFIDGSQLSFASASYRFNIFSWLSYMPIIGVGGGQNFGYELYNSSPTVFLIGNKISFNYSLWIINFTTDINYNIWTPNDTRHVIKIVQEVSWKGVSIIASLYRSSRTIKPFEGNHLYDENSIKEKCMVTLGLKYTYN